MSNIDLRFRQVHLDFHTSPDIEGIGKDFDAEEFAHILEMARVNSVTCFARCHHGMLYYDSKQNPERVHPHLDNRNLLNGQIEACHKSGIRVPIYTTVQWDYYTAGQHPEWLCVNEQGGVNGIPAEKELGPYMPGFYEVLCVNSPYRDFLKAHSKEILELFDPVDGLFFDIVFPVDCSCKYCRQGMLDIGLKPHDQRDRLEYAQQMINGFKLDMTGFIRRYNKDCSIFYNKGHIGTAHKPVTEAYTHYELETLPSGLWGYLHFPVTMRYARNLGKDCVAVTGKFHTMWGDFHSFKNRAALEFECFSMLALGAKCMIGDQLEPNGKLSGPVYDLIGSVHSEVEKKEPWCRGARAVTEVGVFTPEEFTGAGVGELPEAIQGAVRMLQELAVQFDVIDSQSDLTGYKLLVLPDNIIVSGGFAARLKSYIDVGGSVIASFESGLDEGKSRFSLNELGVVIRDQQTCDINGNPVRGKMYEKNNYADYILPKGAIAKGMPETEHVMYMRGLEVEALPDSEILAEAIQPYFNRTYEHFCSHRQAPSSGKTGYAGIVRKGNTIYFSHPIFTQYRQNAPRWCKQLFVNALDMLLSDRILYHSGPSTVLATVNEQVEEKRWVVHLLHYIPERRSKEIDIIEEVIPLYNVKISLKSVKAIQGIFCVPQGKVIDFESKDGRVEFVIPLVNGHQMIAVKYI